MCINMSSVALGLIALIVFILSYVYMKLKDKQSYWTKQKVPHLKPNTLLGNYGDYILLKKTIGEVAQDICKAFPMEPYVGAYYGSKPTLIVQDPEYIKLITTKDFYYFNCRELLDDIYREDSGKAMFFSYGDHWKVLRQNLSPLFSSSKMKSMFHLIETCAHKLEEALDKETHITDVLDARVTLARFTMQSICSCAFGIDTNTLENNPKTNPFTYIGNTIFEISNARGITFVMRSVWPSIFYGLGLQAFPNLLKDFFQKLAIDVFESRNYKPSTRNDFVDLFLALKKNNFITGCSLNASKTDDRVNVKVDDTFMAVQMMGLFAAGYETSASTMGHTLYELAKDQEAQSRAIEEVDEYLRRQKNKLDYECVNELPYLVACIDEALRLYPVLSVLTREVVEDYTLPSGVLLKRGVVVHLPLFHLHRRADYFPEPEKYRPERFLPENKDLIKPYSYFPFGEGPRVCIGKRFSRMQTLSGLLTVLKKYRVELADGMPRTLQFDPRSFNFSAKGGIQLKFLLRDNWQNRILSRETLE